MSLQAVYKKIVIKPVKKEEQTESGIILSNTEENESVITGEIISIGDKVETKDINVKDLEPEDKGVTAEDCANEIEESIHSAIPRLITDKRILNIINEIINEGGWIEDVEGWEFPEDYCKIEIKRFQVGEK